MAEGKDRGNDESDGNRSARNAERVVDRQAACDMPWNAVQEIFREPFVTECDSQQSARVQYTLAQMSASPL